jgi:DNA-damage-inducible protein J
MEEELKKQAEQLFAELGMNMTTAINVFVRQAVNYGGIPFEIVKKDGFHNAGNTRVLSQSIQQLDNGAGMVHDLIDTE